MRGGSPVSGIISGAALVLNKLSWFIGATVGGSIGWWMGERFGFMTAFILSMIGTGAGGYWVRKLVAEYLD